MRIRKRLSRGLEARVLTRCARRCCLCFYLDLDLDEKLGQIAHIDRNPENSKEDNLVFLCLKHHAMYDSKATQYKGYTRTELKSMRQSLWSQLRNLRNDTTRVAWVVQLLGDPAQLDAENISRIESRLKELLDDKSLIIIRVERGSINVIIGSGLRTMLTMFELFESGTIISIDSITILAVFIHEPLAAEPAEQGPPLVFGGGGVESESPPRLGGAGLQEAVQQHAKIYGLATNLSLSHKAQKAIHVTTSEIDSIWESVVIDTDEQMTVGSMVEYFVTIPTSITMTFALLHCIGSVISIELRSPRALGEKRFRVALSMERFEFIRRVIK